MRNRQHIIIVDDERWDGQGTSKVRKNGNCFIFIIFKNSFVGRREPGGWSYNNNREEKERRQTIPVRYVLILIQIDI